MRIGMLTFVTFVLVCSFVAAQDDPPPTTKSDSPDLIADELEKQIGRLEKSLSSERALERQQAARLLGTLHSRLTESAWGISPLLSNPRTADRIAASDALLEFDDRRLISKFLDALSDRDPRVQCRAMIGIDLLIPDYSPPVSNQTTFQPVRVREWYEERAKTISERSVRGLLALACNEPADDIRFAIPIIAKCLGDDDPSLCKRMWGILQNRSLAPEFGRCLSHNDASIRRGAARMLLELESMNWKARETLDAADSLTKGLTDSDPTVRLYCLLTLSKHQQADPTPLMAMIDDQDATVRCAAVKIVRGRKSPHAIAALCRVATHDKSTRVRVRAAFALGYLAAQNAKSRASIDRRITSQHAPRARMLIDIGLVCFWDEEKTKHVPHVNDVSPVITSLFKAIQAERKNPVPDVVQNFDEDGFDATVICALGACGPAARPALPLLMQYLASLSSLGDGDVRTSMENRRLSNSLYALAEIATTRELSAALKHDNRVVRTLAAFALADRKQHAQEVIPVLIESLNHDCWGRCVFSHTRNINVDCLALYGPQAVPALLDLLRTNTYPYAALDALSIMHEDADRVIPLLLPVLKDEHEAPRVRSAVAEALGSTMGDKDASVFQVLADLITDRHEEESVRVAAAQAIRGHGAGDALALLRTVAHDQSAALRKVVEEAIRNDEAASKKQ